MGLGLPNRFRSCSLASVSRIKDGQGMNSKTRFLPTTRPLIMALAFITLVPKAPAAEWKEQVLYSFQGQPDAAMPTGGVAFDTKGNLYGAALGGPKYSQGTVFQVVPPAKAGAPWTESVLYVFQGKGVNDGQIPTSGVIVDAAGNLYGVTGYGGAGGCILLGALVGCGTVYEVSPPQTQGGAGTETILYSFKGGRDGYVPMGNLVFDSSGNLYGTTYFGGGRGTNCDPDYYQYCGTVFKLSPPKQKGGAWTEKVLYSFKGVDNGQQSGDGANPNGGLVMDSKGAIYGSTYFGGNNQKGVCEGGAGGTGCGIVFKLAPPTQKGGAWTERILRAFHGYNDGSNPAGGVVLSAKGDIYGTTYFGPGDGYGMIFGLAPPSAKSHVWTESILYRFTDGSDGANPKAGLSFDAAGNLYGVAGGGHVFSGDVFRMIPPKQQGGSWTLRVLYGFTGPPDGLQPAAAVIFDNGGNVYGATQKGGTGSCYPAGCGTVFEVSP